MSYHQVERAARRRAARFPCLYPAGSGFHQPASTTGAVSEGRPCAVTPSVCVGGVGGVGGGGGGWVVFGCEQLLRELVGRPTSTTTSHRPGRIPDDYPASRTRCGSAGCGEEFGDEQALPPPPVSLFVDASRSSVKV